MSARFETYPQAVAGVPSYGWRLVGGNGEKMARSEGYPSRSNAERGARDVIAAVIDLATGGLYGDAHERIEITEADA